MCSLNILYVSDLLKLGINKLDSLVEFLKCSILHFPNNRYPWDSLVNDLHKSYIPLNFQLPLKTSLSQSYRVAMLRALNPMEFFIVSLINV